VAEVAKGYVLVDVDVTDPQAYQAYKEAAERAVAAHEVAAAMRGGATEVLEGGRTPGRVVVLEFPSVAAARAWFDSPQYQAAAKLRRAASTASFVLAEGVA
jgi:uncharacterized protein (DUF1330 family)